MLSELLARQPKVGRIGHGAGHILHRASETTRADIRQTYLAQNVVWDHVFHDFLKQVLLEVEILELIRLKQMSVTSRKRALTTYHALVLIGELLQNRFHLLSRYEDRILSCDARLLAELVADLPERNVGRVLLVKTQSWTTRDGGRYVEVQVTFTSFLLDTQKPIEKIRNHMRRRTMHSLIEHPHHLHETFLAT